MYLYTANYNFKKTVQQDNRYLNYYFVWASTQIAQPINKFTWAYLNLHKF